MSIDHLKKQAKNLKRLWPEFATSHGEAPSLAACQELIARCSGYASWHAAVSARTASGGDVAKVGLSASAHDALKWTVTIEMESPGSGERALPSARFVQDQSEVARAQRQELLDFDERMELVERRAGSRPASAKANEELLALCNRLLSDNPLFMDAYGGKVCALSDLGRYEEAVEAGWPAFEIASRPLAAIDEVRVSYYKLDNRPFHRLAMAVAYASLKLSDPAKRERGKLIAKSMLKWWPNDNMGFRLLLGKKR